MPPIAGAIKIDRVWMYYPTNGLRSILLILIYILFILINLSCPRVLVTQHKHQSTIIWLGITLSVRARCGGAAANSYVAASSSIKQNRE